MSFSCKRKSKFWSAVVILPLLMPKSHFGISFGKHGFPFPEASLGISKRKQACALQSRLLFQQHQLLDLHESTGFHPAEVDPRC